MAKVINVNSKIMVIFSQDCEDFIKGDRNIFNMLNPDNMIGERQPLKGSVKFLVYPVNKEYPYCVADAYVKAFSENQTDLAWRFLMGLYARHSSNIVTIVDEQIMGGNNIKDAKRIVHNAFDNNDDLKFYIIDNPVGFTTLLPSYDGDHMGLMMSSTDYNIRIDRYAYDQSIAPITDESLKAGRYEPEEVADNKDYEDGDAGFTISEAPSFDDLYIESDIVETQDMDPGILENQGDSPISNKKINGIITLSTDKTSYSEVSMDSILEALSEINAKVDAISKEKSKSIFKIFQ